MTVKIDIVVNEDEDFKIVREDDGVDVEVEAEEKALEEEYEVEFVNGKQPIPAPMTNPGGHEWFNGTSWGITR